MGDICTTVFTSNLISSNHSWSQPIKPGGILKNNEIYPQYRYRSRFIGTGKTNNGRIGNYKSTNWTSGKSHGILN